MNNKFISIIVPCYNASHYLNDLFLSLSNQTYKNFEIIFVDDGSTDDTLNKLKQFSSISEFEVKILTQKNQGPSVARNNGLSASAGEFVYFGDADDIYHPQLFELLYENAVNTDVDLICCGKKRILNSSHYRRSYKTIKSPKKLFINTTDELVSTLLSTSKVGFEAFNKLYRRNILKQLPTYPNIWDKECFYGEDLLLNLQYCSRCSNAIYINETLYYYRLTKNSITNSTFNVKRLTFKKVVDYFYTLDQNKFVNSIPYIKTYLCFISADILFKISKSDFADKEIIKNIYQDFISNWKFCFKAKMAPWYRKYFMWVLVPIIKIAIHKKIKD